MINDIEAGKGTVLKLDFSVADTGYHHTSYLQVIELDPFPEPKENGAAGYIVYSQGVPPNADHPVHQHVLFYAAQYNQETQTVQVSSLVKNDYLKVETTPVLLQEVPETITFLNEE